MSAYDPDLRRSTEWARPSSIPHPEEQKSMSNSSSRGGPRKINSKNHGPASSLLPLQELPESLRTPFREALVASGVRACSVQRGMRLNTHLRAPEGFVFCGKKRPVGIVSDMTIYADSRFVCAKCLSGFRKFLKQNGREVFPKYACNLPGGEEEIRRRDDR